MLSIARYLFLFPKSPDEELVVLSQVLACEATLGYEDITNVQVLLFNGQPVRSLLQLAQMVMECTESFMRFDLEYGEIVVVEREAALTSTQSVLESHSVPNRMSANLRKILNP
eukprot:gene5851-6137_t